jgi:uncharacterized protein (TIGR00255 family)
MTGYGKAEIELAKAKLTIEMKSLNSKQLDLNIRLPYAYNDQELGLRSLISKTLQRGKISIFVNVENTSNNSNTQINSDLIKDYYSQLSGLAKELGIDNNKELLPTIMRLPDVITTEKEEVDKDDIHKFNTAIKEAIDKIDEFRIQEGEVLENDFRKRISNIVELLSQVDQFENIRVEKIKERIEQALNNQIDESQIDKNRLEQELIFYIEKLDITEEKVRLSQHCEYFIETLDNKSVSKGKKLGFILQEIGREINTLGSKSNDSNMQKIVVQMKDELEKIKEQSLNIL